MKSMTTCLWFDTQAEEAANFYVSVFPDSKVGKITRYGSAGPRPAGMVMTVEFELRGQKFMGLNGGPEFRFTEAVSFVVNCEGQAEVDHYYDTLLQGGEESVCGWLKDRFGLSWQVTPTILPKLIGDPDPAKAQRVMAAMMQMKKIIIADLERAASGA